VAAIIHITYKQNSLFSYKRNLN